VLHVIGVASMSSQDMKTAIHVKLVQSGEKEKLKEHLRIRLIESGWRDQVGSVTSGQCYGHNF
jgi:hypothetical protein